VHDLAVIVVSTNEAHWLRPCLSTVFERAGDISLDVVVADNESTDGTRELVEQEFPSARVVTCENHGFAHANNRGWLTCDARYALFLNPDTEIVDGTFAELVAELDARPEVGLVGVRQLMGDGSVFPTIRRFPNALRAGAEALGSEHWPVRNRWTGERELRMELYERETPCDWTSGSFMLVRREALLAAGLLDERFFIYSEEPDLCLRVTRAGWRVTHLPTMTIIHHADKAGIRPKMAAQDTLTRMQYARKHFSPLHRSAYRAAIGLRYALRYAAARGADAALRREAAVAALAVLTGRGQPPFGTPAETALRTDRAGADRASRLPLH
jgi:GT2 family glycosyltransferase